MLVTVYARMVKTTRGVKSERSGNKPSNTPLTDSYGDPLPTAMFAMNLEVPGDLF